MMFTEAIDCVLACTSWVWSSVAPLAIALYFAYLLYTVAVPTGPATVEMNMKNTASLDDVSTDAGESDSEGSSRSEEGSDESVHAAVDDDASSSVADACLDAVTDGMVYSRDLLLAYRMAPPPPPPGLEKPRAMYFTQKVETRAPSMPSSRAGAWGGDHWAGYHSKQVRVKTTKSMIEAKTSPKISPKATAVRPTPPWLNRATVLQTFTA